MSRYRFITQEQSVAPACSLLGVSRSAFYQWRQQEDTPRRRGDATLSEQIARIHRDSRGTYGVPRVQGQLRLEGITCGRQRLRRLMRDAGLSGQLRRRSRRTTLADPSHHAVAPDRVQRAFTPSAALNRVWVGDITYLRTGAGWAYLATVLDLASRRVVGFAVADHLRTSLVTEAFRMAVTARRPQPGLVFHSDRGSQYTSREFKDLLAQHGTVSSLSRPHQCWDNAVAESFFATLKTELIHRRSWSNLAAVRLAVFEYVEGYYNRQRLHSSLGHRSPAAYEQAILQGAATVAA